MDTIIRHVLIGELRPLGPSGVASGIDKRPAAGPVAVTAAGLAGDRQADRRHHGGPDKAIHHYPFDHYAAWRGEHPDLAPRLAAPGAFGENLSTLGLTEAEVCIGDVFRLGSARVQVSQARQPCWKLNLRFGEPAMARRVQSLGRTGWYYRVLEAGQVAAGDRLELLERPHPDWPLARLLRLLHAGTLDRDALRAMARLPELAESWRVLAARCLERNAVEDWSRRLTTPSPMRGRPGPLNQEWE